MPLAINISAKKVRVLHSVGHLLRGGIENWLFQTLTRQPKSIFEHHVLVRTIDEEAFSDSFRQAGISVLPCPNYHNPLRYAHDLKNLIKEHGPYDILHVHGSSFSGLLTLCFGKAFGIRKTIVHSHNDVRPLLQNSGFFYTCYARAVTTAYCLLGDRGLAASILAAESMFGMKWKQNPNWRLLYYGIDCIPYHHKVDPTLRTRLGIPQEAYVVGHVGRFHPQKNHEFLIEVIHEARDLDPQIHCLLIGDGPLLETVRSEIRSRGLTQNFTMITDTTAISDFMISAMDCFLFPSLYEGLGLVAVEAQAAGLPCLLSNRIPHEATVNPSLVKWLSLECSPAKWARQILEFKDTAPIRDETSFTQVENSRFDIERCVNSLQLQYMELARE